MLKVYPRVESIQMILHTPTLSLILNRPSNFQQKMKSSKNPGDGLDTPFEIKDLLICQALTWILQGNRKQGHPKNTWPRDLEAETKRSCFILGQHERLAKDRATLRALVGGLCSSRDQSNDDDDDDDDDDDCDHNLRS